MKEWQQYTESEQQKVRQLSVAVDRYSLIIDKLQNLNTPCLQERLRLNRHIAWRNAATATLLKSEPATVVCRYWSESTLIILQQLFEELEFKQDHVALFALGKLGSLELNLSSDIDIVWISKNPPTPQLLKKIQEFTRLLSNNTEFGFCYRVDYDLRPGGRMGPLVGTLEQYSDYYWAHGQTWERIAHVRFLDVIGNKDITEMALAFRKRFCFRKFTDANLISDLKRLRSQVRQSHKIPSHQNFNEFNLKLGVGGIRDIELFTHALLLMHGGRSPDLVSRETDGALKSLESAHFLNHHITKILIDSYWYYRQLENELQALRDQQTHTLHLGHSPIPSTVKGEELYERIREVERLVFDVLGPSNQVIAKLPFSLDEQIDYLVQKGFDKNIVESSWPKVSFSKISSKNAQLDEFTRSQVLDIFIAELQSYPDDKNIGLGLLCDFLNNIRAKKTFYSLMLVHSNIISRLTHFFCHSPHLGAILTRRPELIDSYFFQYNDELLDDTQNIYERLPEHKLIKEINNCEAFIKDRNLPNFVAENSALADIVIQHLTDTVCKDVGIDDLDILALGKWGGYELGIQSDIDFIFVSKSRPQQPHMKAARRIIHRITDIQKSQALYDIDLRLRPSGQSGPLLVQEQALIDFLKNKAEPWQRQSYLRSRSVFQKTQIKEVLKSCVAKTLSNDDLISLANIRKKLFKQHSLLFFDLKYGPGGLLEMEFLGQHLYLHHRQLPASTTTPEQLLELSKKIESIELCELSKIYIFIRTIEQLNHLFGRRSQAELKLDSDAFKRIARIFGMPEANLIERIKQQLDRSHAICKILDPLNGVT